MCVWVGVCVCGCVRKWVGGCMHVPACGCACMCMRMRICVWVYTSRILPVLLLKTFGAYAFCQACAISIYVRRSGGACVCMCVYKDACPESDQHMCACYHTCVTSCACMHACAHVYMYIYVCVHTCNYRLL